MENNSYISHLRSQIREHKHNYSEDFGLIVRLPTQRLFRELITNPDTFSDEECRLIIDAYTASTRIVAKQEQLGYTLEEQLNELKTKSIPKIKDITETYTRILQNHLELPNRSLISILQSAVRDAGTLCDKLQKIEDEDYGKSEPFLLRTAILRKFQKENNRYGVEGLQSMEIETSFTECYDAKADMNEDSFTTHVIGNIIKNLHEHAFMIEMDPVIDKETYDIIAARQKKYHKLLDIIYRIPFFNRFFRKINNKPPKDKSNIRDFTENKVRIVFKKDEEHYNRLDIFIENNGKPFIGDFTKVFELGVGEGEGDHIGLYSAKKFLEFYGASILMYKPDYEDYTVGIKINLKIV